MCDNHDQVGSATRICHVMGTTATGSTRVHEHTSCPRQLVCPLFLVSFALVRLAEQHGHAWTASNIVTLVHCTATVPSLADQRRIMLLHQSLRHIGFPANSACESILGECSGSFCLAQRRFSSVLVTIAALAIALPDSHALVMEDSSPVMMTV